MNLYGITSKVLILFALFTFRGMAFGLPLRLDGRMAIIVFYGLIIAGLGHLGSFLAFFGGHAGNLGFGSSFPFLPLFFLNRNHKGLNWKQLKSTLGRIKFSSSSSISSIILHISSISLRSVSKMVPFMIPSLRSPVTPVYLPIYM